MALVLYNKTSLVFRQPLIIQKLFCKVSCPAILPVWRTENGMTCYFANDSQDSLPAKTMHCLGLEISASWYFLSPNSKKCLISPYNIATWINIQFAHHCQVTRSTVGPISKGPSYWVKVSVAMIRFFSHALCTHFICWEFHLRKKPNDSSNPHWQGRSWFKSGRRITNALLGRASTGVSLFRLLSDRHKGQELFECWLLRKTY